MRRVLALFVTLLMSVTIFSACSSIDTKIKKVPDMQAGTWGNDIFTNEWCDISIPLPDSYIVFTAAEVKEAIGETEIETIYNGTDGLSGTLDASKSQVLYDFAIGSANVSLISGYQNLVGSTKYLTLEKYLESEKKYLQKESFTYLSSSSQTIAGKKYTSMAFTENSDGTTLYSDLYARKHGHYIIFFVATYAADGKTEAQTLLQTITKVGETPSVEVTASRHSSAPASSDRAMPKVNLG